MRNFLKLSGKIIYKLLMVYVILTLIISITKISTPQLSRVDLNKMSGYQREAFFKRYGSDLSTRTFLSSEELFKEVIAYYKRILKGDVGYIYKVSKRYTAEGQELHDLIPVKPIGEILKVGLSRSMKLLSTALAIAIFLGILKGVNDSKKDKATNSTFKLFTTVLGLSLPVIFLGPLLQFIVLGIFRRFGFGVPLFGHQSLKHIILPVITLAILPTMYVARLTAVAIDNAYQEEYVRTAISKGSTKLRVLWLHVFRNVVVELAGSIPSILTIVISDLVLVEYLFKYKGLTHTMLEYYEKGQSDVVTGFALSLSIIFAMFYMFFKTLRFALDPKGRRSTL